MLAHLILSCKIHISPITFYLSNDMTVVFASGVGKCATFSIHDI